MIERGVGGGEWGGDKMRQAEREGRKGEKVKGEVVKSNKEGV